MRAPQGVGVPIDTKIWLSYAPPFPLDPMAFHLVGPEAEIAVTPTTLGTIVLLKPLENLAPMTVYRAFHCTDGQASFEAILGCENVLEFTTGNGVSQGVPEVPQIVDREEHYTPGGKDNSSCGSKHPQYSVNVTYQTSGEIIVLDFGTSQFDPHLLSGPIDFVDDTKNSMFQAFYGNSGCATRAPGQNQDRLTVRVGALNLAGHFSGWSEPDTIVMPKGGCSLSATQDRGLWLALGMLGLLTWRRRPKN